MSADRRGPVIDVRSAAPIAALATLVVTTTLAFTWGETDEPVTDQPVTHRTARSVPAAPAPAPDRTQERRARDRSVTVSQPSIRIEDPAPGALEQVRDTPGVAAAAAVRIGSVPLGLTSDAELRLRVAAVDPATFRPLSPQPTAEASGVWERLDDGEAAVTHGRAAALGLELGEQIELGGTHGITVRVGALASNGTPPVADAIVDRVTGSRLGLDRVAPTILVATDGDVDVAELADRLAEVTDASVEVIPDPRAPVAVSPEQQRDAATVWDALAACESGGRWHLDSGNGFYGGVQFLPESWHLVGGSGMPHEASRAEQIHRAERLLQIQGWDAWPACSVLLGLRPASGG